VACIVGPCIVQTESKRARTLDLVESLEGFAVDVSVKLTVPTGVELIEQVGRGGAR
jgi:hypothetical protein